MTNLQDIEPFLYDAAPINASPEAAEQTYYAVGESLRGNYNNLGAAVPPPQASASSTQINESAVEDYLNRILEATRRDIAALDARITALEP